MSRRGNGQVWDPAPTPGVGMDGGETETEGVEVPDSRLSPLPPPPPAPPLDGKDLSASPYSKYVAGGDACVCVWWGLCKKV